MGKWIGTTRESWLHQRSRKQTRSVRFNKIGIRGCRPAFERFNIAPCRLPSKRWARLCRFWERNWRTLHRSTNQADGGTRESGTVEFSTPESKSSCWFRALPVFWGWWIEPRTIRPPVLRFVFSRVFKIKPSYPIKIRQFYLNRGFAVSAQFHWVCKRIYFQAHR